jgi:biopolymer transport protein ExbB
MKKVLAFLTVFGLLSVAAPTVVLAQNEAESEDTTAVAAMDEGATEDVAVAADDSAEPVGIHKVIKTKFIEGGAGFMGIVVLCLIFGLALAIERIVYLNLSAVNTKKLLAEVEDKLNNEGVEAAMEVCRNTRGPVASIFYQGLSRMDEGIDVVEKTVTSYGSVQMGLLEKGLSWISLFISIAPGLGFMGTVIGMIAAFDMIQQAGDISATIVAGGIKIALLTTVTGLIVATILQLFYNYIITLIDAAVNNMEDSSISLLDIIVKYNAKK